MSEIAAAPIEEEYSSIKTAEFDRQELFIRCKEDLNFLAGLAMPTVFTVLFPPFFHAIWGVLREKCTFDNIFRLLLAVPRGHAKTTFIKLFCLYVILFTNRQFILIICATQDKAENFLSDVADMLSEDNIVNIFGDWKLSIEKDTQQLKKFTFMGRDIIIFATGQGSVRGLNLKHRRPDMVIMDDAQDKENAESPTESHKILRWIQSTVMKLRDPRRCFFIYIGNKYKVAPDCVCVLERLQKNPLWVHIVTGAILEDGNPLWPELHSMENLMEEFQNDFNMGTPEIFLSEVMNDTESSLHSIVDLTKVPFSPYDREEERVLCQGRFVVIDTATNKVGADDTTIGLYGIYDQNRINFEELDLGSYSPKEVIINALKMCFKSGANVIGVDATSYQSTLLFWFNEVCTELGIGQGLHFVELQSIGKKNKRLIAFIKQLISGQEFFVSSRAPERGPLEEQKMSPREALFKQISSFKPSKDNNVDDIIDNAHFWQQMIEKYGHLIALPTKLEIQAAGEISENCCSF